MRAMDTIVVDLSLPQAKRFECLEPHRAAAQELIAEFAGQLGCRLPAALLAPVVKRFLPPWYQADIRSASRVLEVSLADMLVANLYYDALKASPWATPIGCSAVAVESGVGPVHGRNLDWMSSGILSSASAVLQYRNGPQDYDVVGWPGFVGALSGMAPGKFSITLNYVSSAEKARLTGRPISVLIREVLATAADFDEAVRVLSATPILSDCLLMVVGTKRGERVVIERTPRTGHLVTPTTACEVLAATNSYSDGTGKVRDCHRHSFLTRSCEGAPQTPFPIVRSAILRALDCEIIKMDITAQQMLFCPATGVCSAYKA